MLEIKIGSRFFWGTAIFPYVVQNVTNQYVYYKRAAPTEFETKRIYRHVFEEDMKRGRIEFL